MKNYTQDKLFEVATFSIAVILSIIGVISVYSAGSYQLDPDVTPTSYMIRQLIFMIMSLITCFIMMRLKYKWFTDYQMVKSVLMVMLLLLIIVLFLPATKGARAWINLGFVSIQPAEFAKVLLIWITALYFSKTRYLPNLPIDKRDSSLKQLWAVHHQEAFPIICYVMIMSLVMIQPDTGGAMIMFLMIGLIWLASGLFRVQQTIKLLSVTLIGLIVVAILTIFILGVDNYRSIRLISFINPFAPSNLENTYQIRNSFYALANGGLFGVGIGRSVQKTGYLPENQTDFILSIIGEEFGFIGVLVVVGLLMALVIIILRRSFMLKNTFNRFMLMGIAMMFMIQILFNVGGITSLLPLTGVTLPFISYGGSSLLVNFIAIGLVLKFSIMDRKLHSQVTELPQSDTTSQQSESKEESRQDGNEA